MPARPPAGPWLVRPGTPPKPQPLLSRPRRGEAPWPRPAGAVVRTVRIRRVRTDISLGEHGPALYPNGYDAWGPGRSRMRATRRGWLRFLAAATMGLAFSARSTPGFAQKENVVVFAAASLKNALDEIEAACSEQTGERAVISYAASSALAKQIEEGAPADIFISADLDWMDYLAERDLIRADTRSNLLGNRIVLIAPKDSDIDLDIRPGFDLAGALGEGRLAMANTESVPAGKYGKAALQALGAWEAMADRVAQAENVRAALML